VGIKTKFTPSLSACNKYIVLLCNNVSYFKHTFIPCFDLVFWAWFYICLSYLYLSSSVSEIGTIWSSLTKKIQHSWQWIQHFAPTLRLRRLNRIWFDLIVYWLTSSSKYFMHIQDSNNSYNIIKLYRNVGGTEKPVNNFLQQL
jgi:hypothetical protein